MDNRTTCKSTRHIQQNEQEYFSAPLWSWLSYLDVSTHAEGQHSHQYGYCGMSHFSHPPLFLFWRRSCYFEITESNIRCLVTLAGVSPTAPSCDISVSASCSLLPTAAWDLLRLTEPSPVSAGIFHGLDSRRSHCGLVKSDIWWRERDITSALLRHFKEGNPP